VIASQEQNGSYVTVDSVDSELGLAQVWEVLKRRWLTAALIFTGVTAAVTFYGLSRNPIYEAEGKLRFKSQDTTSTLTGLADELARLESLDATENPIRTEIGIIRTSPIIKETISTLNLRDENGDLLKIDDFLRHLDLSNERGTDILEIAYQSSDANLAERVVNTLMRVYLDQHLLANRAETTAARAFIENQLPSAEARALRAEAELREFKERNNLIDLEEETSATVTSLEALETKITDVTSALADTNAQFSVLQSKLRRDPQAALAMTALGQSAGVQQVLADYQAVETELAAERVRFQDQHPRIADLETQRRNLEQVLSERVTAVIGESDLPADANLQVGEVEAELVADYIRLNAQLEGLTQQAQVLQASEAIQQTRAQMLPRLGQEQRELERRLEAAQATYSLLLQRLQEVRVAENQNVGNVRVIQPAELLSDPVAPRKMLYVFAGAMLGGLLAAGTALLLEAQDNSIKTVDEAKARFGLPVLGVIPTVGRTGDLIRRRESDDRLIPNLLVCEQQGSLAAEAYHMLRNNLKYLNSDNPPKVLAISSSLPREGKSTVASNLATSMAQSGQRVLLIDADLQNPIQQWIWDMNNHRGLSHVLVGEAALDETVTEVMPNLSVLLAGVTPPNPAALLDSQRMTEMLQEFKAQYDFVILDTPTLSGGASASILGKMSDGLLLVARPGVANHQSANYAKSLLEQSQQKVLGLVVNGAISNYEPYGHYLSEEFFEEARLDPEQGEGNSLSMEITSSDEDQRQ
jgi:capsular exopolysaccharide synthesis family protein